MSFSPGFFQRVDRSRVLGLTPIERPSIWLQYRAYGEQRCHFSAALTRNTRRAWYSDWHEILPACSAPFKIHKYWFLKKEASQVVILRQLVFILFMTCSLSKCGNRRAPPLSSGSELPGRACSVLKTGVYMTGSERQEGRTHTWNNPNTIIAKIRASENVISIWDKQINTFHFCLETKFSQ